MKLFKNVDIRDLPAILAEGILPISVTGNDNWDDGRRASNSREVVYLFNAERGASFVNYGTALIEVDVEDATENALLANDANVGLYTEFIAAKVAPEAIVAVYVPEQLRAAVPAAIAERVTFVTVSAQMTDWNLFKELTRDLEWNDFAGRDAAQDKCWVPATEDAIIATLEGRGYNYTLKDLRYSI